MIIKNKTTPRFKEFWDHVESIVAQMREKQPCAKPPYGWLCTRYEGHEGPCPTVRVPIEKGIYLTAEEVQIIRELIAGYHVGPKGRRVIEKLNEVQSTQARKAAANEQD